MMPMMTW